jgi:hypothetical protein
MGLLNLFHKSDLTLLRLPSGSFTVDRGGSVLTTTLPSHFPGELVRGVAEVVLGAFRGATAAQLPLSELVISYPSLRITARSMRGGAIIFVAPRAPYA